MIQRRSFLSAFGGAVSVRPSSPRWTVQRRRFDLAARHGMRKTIGWTRLQLNIAWSSIRTTPDGFGHALVFGSNFLDTNKNAYGLEYSDVALMIIVRHNSTPFAYNDMMWSKYGTVFAQKAGFSDPKTKESPRSNLFNASGYGSTLTSNGVTLDSLIKRGLHLGVCRLATRNIAGLAATATGGDANKINDELIANIVANAHMVPAGIVAVNRAQERGYTFAAGI